METRTLSLISLVLFCSLIFGSSITVTAEDEGMDPAEVVAYLDTPTNIVPAIQVSNFTSIDITVVDAFGIPWEQLSTGRYRFMAKYVWPIIHPNWKPFLGFTALQFEPEVVEGDGRGWFTKVTPSAIANADQGKIYNITLDVKVDDISVDYAVVIGIKVTRLDVFGQEFGVSYIYVPVKSSQLNNIKMNFDETTKEAAPKSYVTYTAEITNRGYYRGMFELKFDNDDEMYVSTSNKVIVLESGETKQLNVQVLTPEKLFDVGTPYEIRVLATSSGDPNPVHVASIRVISKGIYISPLAFYIAAPIIIIILLVFLFFFHMRQKRERELFGKPEKPWNILEEKQHLNQLKKQHPDKYQEELAMMRDEYQSALLWFESYKNKMKPAPSFTIKLPIFIRKKSSQTSPKKEALEEKKEEITTTEKSENSSSAFEEHASEVSQPTIENTEIASQAREPSKLQKNSGFFSSIKRLVMEPEPEEQPSEEKEDQVTSDEKPKEPVVPEFKEVPNSEPVIDEKILAKKREKEEKLRKKKEAEAKIKKAQDKQRKKLKR